MTALAMHRFLSTLISLLCAATACLSAPAPGAERDPGGIIFIGDSITQGGKYLAGTQCASYRYSLFKNFVDNETRFLPMGTVRTPAWGAKIPMPDYREHAFPNVSEAAASGRSYQFSGHAPQAKDGAQYQPNPSSVSPAANRGPLSAKFGIPDSHTGKVAFYYNGATETQYTGDTYRKLYGNTKAQTATILLGINDLYDRNPSASGGRFSHSPEAILGHLRRIVSTLQEYNEDIRIVVLELLPVGKDNGARHQGIEQFNAKLRQAAPRWSTRSSNVSCADVSSGFCAENGEMIDTARGAHPNAQGELIIAGNLARVLGIGQRNLGYERRKASQLVSRLKPAEQQIDLPQSDGVRVGTYEVKVSQKRGKRNGGDTGFTLVVGDGVSGAGLLTVEKDALYWGDPSKGVMLYKAAGRFSQKPYRIRIVVNQASSGKGSVYQVWLGEQLVGENLATNLPGTHKNSLRTGMAASATRASISGIFYELGTAYAP